MGALGFGMRQMRRRASVLAARGATPPLSAVASDGWRATVAVPTDLSMLAFDLRRTGFNSAAQAVTIVEAGHLTKRVRQVYPNQATPTPTTVALDDYLYATDAIAGVVNNSTEASPKPIAAWAMPSRLLVGNAVDWELVAFHRDGRAGRQVACVRVRGNDGTTQTAWQTVSTTAISTSVEDAQPIEVYQATLDVSAMATGLFWLEAEIYPWIGAAASVLKSEDQSDPREFWRRFFTKNVALAAAAPLVYVASTGNDATGVCSTVAATAAASPCLTVAGAMNKAKAASGITGGVLDGVRIRLVDTVAWGTLNGATYYPQSSAALVIERAPGTARSAAILQQSATTTLRLGYSASTTVTLTSPLTEAAVILRDISYRRTAAGQIANGSTLAGLDLQVWNSSFDNGSVVGAWGGTGASGLRLYGVIFTALSSFFTYNPTFVQRLHRGVTGDVSGGSIEEWVKLGCKMTAKPGTGTYRDATKGFITYGCVFLAPSAINATASITAASAGLTITGIALVQNVWEVAHATSSTPAWQLSADNMNGSIVHAVIQHNVVTGYNLAGRVNVIYDESSGTNRRGHRLLRCTGNIFAQLNTKGDVFVATSQGNPGEAPNRTGQLAFSHGVGCQGNFTMFATAAPASEAQVYAGLGSSIGTSTATRNDPLFVNYQGTTGSGGTTYTAGAGGGDYRLQARSTARGIVSVAVLRFDLAGAARGAGVQAAGGHA